MSWPLRQSTASQEIPLGPFVDSTDGNTAETGLTIANTDIKLQKNGATTQANKNSGGATHIATGDYYTVLDATDTDTLGPMRVKVHVSGALPVWLDCCVYDEFAYDHMFGTTMMGNLGIIATGTIQSPTDTTHAQLAAATSFVDDLPNGATLLITGGTGAGQARGFSDWVSTTDTALLDPPLVTPTDGTTTYVVFGTPPGPTSSLPTVLVDAASVRTAVGMASANMDTQLSTIDTVVDAVKAKTDSLNFTVAGQVDSNVQRVNDVEILGDGSGTPFHV